MKMEQIDIHKLSAVEVEEVIEIHEAWKNFCKACSKCPLLGAIFSCEVAFAIQYIKNKNKGIDNSLQPKFKQGETVFVIEFAYNFHSAGFEKCVKEYKIRKVFVNKKSISYLLYRKKYRYQERSLFKTYEDAEKVLNKNENI